MLKQRDIVFIPFPYTNLSKIKKRPALILSNKNTFKSICCAITKNPNRKGIYIRNNDLYNGELKYNSTIIPDSIFTIDKSIVVKKVGTLNKDKTKEVINSVCKAIAIE